MSVTLLWARGLYYCACACCRGCNNNGGRGDQEDVGLYSSAADTRRAPGRRPVGHQTQGRVHEPHKGDVDPTKCTYERVFLWKKITSSNNSARHVQYVGQNKEADNDWFRLESNKDGTRWFGKCWYVHNLLKYEFSVEFDVSGERQCMH